MSRERIASVVLAAGAARRFGGRKQLAPLHGRPLLEHALAIADASPSEETIVVLGAFADEVRREVDLGGARVVLCEDWRRGRGASLRAGLAVLGPEVAAALVTLGDQPQVAAAASRRLLESRRPGQVCLRATYGGRPGHPVLIERPLFPTLLAALPEAKPAALLREVGVAEIGCDDLGDPADVDTPAELEALEEEPA